MIWANIGVFFISTVKFLFAAAAGWKAGNTFWETFFIISAGGMFGMTIFYYFIDDVVRLLLHIEWLTKVWKKLTGNIRALFGFKRVKTKKTFTKFNRFIVRMKHNPYGLYIIALLGASFISIPVGAILAASFYSEKKHTILVLYAAVLFVAIITTRIAYLF